MSVVSVCCWEEIRSCGPSYLSADTSREKHHGRPEQQNPSGQGQTSSCASEAVAARISWGKCCSLNPNLSKTHKLSNLMIGESKTREKK